MSSARRRLFPPSHFLSITPSLNPLVLNLRGHHHVPLPLGLLPLLPLIHPSQTQQATPLSSLRSPTQIPLPLQSSPVIFATHLAQCPILAARASATNAEPSTEEEFEEYEVELDKPYGLRFAKGSDGGTYIDAIASGGSADKSRLFTVGDKVLATSAVFGTEIWPAAEYGRTMYTIRQRIGPLLMKMQRRYGKVEFAELTDKEIIRAERNSGVISNRVREIQMQNYLKLMEQKERREKELRDGLKFYKDGKYEEALEKFESVLGSKPEPKEASVASYNVACCYSKLKQVQAGLSALEDAMRDGYEDFKTIRSDPDLANLRDTEEFGQLMEKFDESFINENAINAIKSLFGIFNKK